MPLQQSRLASPVPVDPHVVHPHCVVCGQANPNGLSLRFAPAVDSERVVAQFDCSWRFEGYAGLLHGGIVSAVLDGAMAHCLFQLGRVGYTGSLEVRFRQPVVVGRPATVEARLRASRGRRHVLEARLEQDGQVNAEASARFVEARADA